MQATNIGWTDFSGNLIKYRDPDGNIVNACIKASEGCRGCYAEVLAPRWGRKGKRFTAENMKRLTPFFDEKEAKAILGSKKISGKRFFHGDMTDWMGPWVPDEIIDQCFAVFGLRQDVIFQTLTKHADRLLQQTTRLSRGIEPLERAARAMGHSFRFENVSLLPWPLPNLHLGISAETQGWYDKRWRFLEETPAVVKFVSYEPALGALTAIRGKRLGNMDCPDWLIIGAESGTERREMPLKAVLKTIDDCRAAGLPVYVKQDGALRPGQQGRIPDSYWVKEWPN